MLRPVFQCLLLWFCILGTYCQNPEVEIPQGRLRGGTRTNLDGGTYYSFQSIPYGRPPIGGLRFRASEPADAWEGTLDATQDVPECIQQGAIADQEDCLYLSLYTPGLPEENITGLSVMVFIHGGAFTGGSASETLYGAQFLLTKDVILVVINYRLGIFGFLSLDDPDLGVTGNAGLKDQVLALEWVRDNIEYFGGNSNDVTIFGESAGSMSVQLLLLSPMANGLFHKAISQSGDATTSLLDSITRNNGAVVAEYLGIQTENWEDMLASLQDIPATNLAIAEVRIYTNFYRVFAGPIVEIASNRTFIQQKPIDIIKSGTYNQVPFIIGVNDAEGLLFQYATRVTSGESFLIQDFTEFIPDEFNVQTGSVLEELLAFIIRFFYYGDRQPSRDNITEAVELVTDFGFAFPAYRTTREYLRTTESPIYFYYFTAVTDLNFMKSLDETVAAFPGVSHADDLGYLFYADTTPPFSAGSVEDRVLRSVVELWTNFAIYGNPTPANSSDFIWLPVQEDQFSYLEIATNETFPILNSIFTEDRLQFWDNLYEDFGSR